MQTFEPQFNKFVRTKPQLPGRTPFLIAADVPGRSRPGKAPEVGKEMAEIETYEEFIATISDEQNRYCNLYEIVDRMEAPVWAMFDIDLKNPSHTPQEVIVAFESVVKIVVKELLSREFALAPGETCQVSDSSTPEKLSLHVKLCIGMRSVHDNKRFALAVVATILRLGCPELLDASSRTGTIVDLNIYTNWRQFRMLYQAKLFTTRYLLPSPGSSTDAAEHLWRIHPGHTREPLWWADFPTPLAKPTKGMSDGRASAVHKKKPPHDVKRATARSSMVDVREKTEYFNSIPALTKVMSGPVDVMSITHLVDHGDSTIYTLRDAVCPYKGARHSNNHVYFMTHAGSSDVHVRCHNEKCKKAAQWTVYDNSPLETSWFDETCLDGMHQQAANVAWAEDYNEPEMRDLPLESIVLVRAGMGTGKTKALLRLANAQLAADPAKKALIVTFSRSLAAKLHADFAGLDFTDYAAVKGGAPLTGARIVVCLDSLWRVNTRNFDFVFIDEAVSVFLHFNSTKMERAHVNSGVLELLLLQCERMYLVDACVDTTMMKHIADYLAAHRGCGTCWVRNRHVRPSTRRAVVRTSLASGNCIAENLLARAAMSRVMELLEEGKNVVVCSSTKRFATTLEEYVRAKRGSTSVLSYYSGKTESLKDVESLWTSCQLLIYSPSVSAGVSFEGDHFHSLVGFLVNSPGTPSVDLSLQQLFRVRNLADGEMALFVQDFNADEEMPHTDEQVASMLAADASIPNKYYLDPQLQAMSKTTVRDGRLVYDNSRMSYLVVKGIVTMRNKSLLRYRAILTKTLREDYGIPCAESFEETHAYDLDLDVLHEAGKHVADVAFEDVPIFAAMEDGHVLYQAVSANMESSGEADKAGKVLHDYAFKMWRIPVDKIDEDFYLRFVRAPDASATYFKAKRFVAMTTKSVLDIRRTMSYMMDNVMATEDPNLKVFRTKIRAHYALLLKSHELVTGCLSCAEFEAFASLEDVTISDDTMREQLLRLTAAMDPGELAHFYRVLDLKDTVKPFVLFRKIMATAFGFRVERRNDDRRCRGWSSIDVRQDWLRDARDAYAPEVLSADEPVDRPLVPPGRAVFSRRAGPSA